MSKAAFEAIKDGLEEAVAFNKGQTKGARVSTYPDEVDVAAIRKRTGLSQAKFCATFGFSKPTFAKWEQRTRRPTGPARALLKVIAHNPNAVLEALDAPAVAPRT